MRLGALDTKRPYLAGFTVIEDHQSQQQFISNVVSMPLYGPKVDELEASLKNSSATLCSTPSPQTNRLSVAYSLVSNFASLESGLRQTAGFTNILVFPPQGLLAPLGGDPAQASDAYQSNLLFRGSPKNSNSENVISSSGLLHKL